MTSKQTNIFVLVRITPPLKDPGELSTILGNSIRILFGDCQAHFSEVIQLGNETQDGNDTQKELGIIKTDMSSVNFICAALTLAVAPSFMNTLYRIDILQKKTDIKHISIF